MGAAIVNGSMSIQHVIVPQHVSANFLGVYGQVTVNTAANTSVAYLDYTGLGGIYTRTGSTLNLLSSGSYTSAISWSSNGTGPIVGPRPFYVSMDMNMTPGEYHLMVVMSTANTATGGANTTALGNSISLYGGSQIATGASNIFNAIQFGVNTVSFFNAYIGMGVYTASTTDAVPASINITGLNGAGTGIQRANIVIDLRTASWPLIYMRPQIILPDIGAHNRDFAASRTRLLKGQSYRDLSTVCVIPLHPGRTGIHPRVVQAFMNLMAPMNQKFTRIFLTSMEIGDAYTSAVETILANPDCRPGSTCSRSRTIICPRRMACSGSTSQSRRGRTMPWAGCIGRRGKWGSPWCTETRRSCPATSSPSHPCRGWSSRVMGSEWIHPVQTLDVQGPEIEKALVQDRARGTAGSGRAKSLPGPVLFRSGVGPWL